jgi:hypothetical protein
VCIDNGLLHKEDAVNMASQLNSAAQSSGNSGADMPTRISGFIERHRLLSSFLCLMIAPILTDSCIVYSENACRGDWIRTMIYAVGLKLWCVIPVFLISLRLSSYLRRQKAVYPETFAERFVTSAVASFITFTVSLLILIHKYSFLLLGGKWWHVYNPYMPSELTIVSLNASVYGILFGAFFGSQTRGSVGSIIYQSSIITFLILLWYILSDLVSHIHI